MLDEYGGVGIKVESAEGLADGRSEHTSFAVINDADEESPVTNSSLTGDHGSRAEQNASIVDSVKGFFGG